VASLVGDAVPFHDPDVGPMGEEPGEARARSGSTTMWATWRPPIGSRTFR
jgi:hypothetical protein